ATTRVPALVGSRDGRGRLQSALGPGLDRGPTAEVRRRVLRLLAELPPGTAPEPGAVQARVRCELPRRMPGELRPRLVGATRVEAEQLGVTGRGALASWSRALLDPDAAPGGPAADADAGTAEAGTAEAGTGAAGAADGDARAAGATPATAVAALLLGDHLPTPLYRLLLQPDLTAV